MLTRNEKKLQKAKARLNDSRRLLKKYEDKYAAGRLSDRQFAKWTRFWSDCIEVGNTRVVKYQMRVAEEAAARSAQFTEPAEPAEPAQSAEPASAANIAKDCLDNGVTGVAFADAILEAAENVVPINDRGQHLLDIAAILHDQGEISDDLFGYIKDAAQGKAEWNLTGDKETYIENAIKTLKRRFPHVAA